MYQKTFLVIGASGHVGTAVVEGLVQAGHFIRAVTNKSTLSPHPQIEQHIVDITQADLQPLFDAVDGAFLMVPVRPDMVAIGRRLNDAAIVAQTARIVRLSAATALQRPEIFVGTAHSEIDHDLLTRRADALILRPHGFMQNLLGQAPAIRHGVLAQPLAINSADALIDTHDIARGAVFGLLSNEVQGAVDLTGPQSLSPATIAATITEMTGRVVLAQMLSNEQARQGMSEIGISAWLIERILETRIAQESGSMAATTDGVLRLTGTPPNTLTAFLEAHATTFGIGG